MSMVGKTIVRGHGLRLEGMAHYSADCYENPCHGFRHKAHAPGQRGHALCSCGEMSPHLTSGGQRKRWHREHKAAVVAAANSREAGNG